jgi:hypothetical protein
MVVVIRVLVAVFHALRSHFADKVGVGEWYFGRYVLAAVRFQLFIGALHCGAIIDSSGRGR